MNIDSGLTLRITLILALLLLSPVVLAEADRARDKELGIPVFENNSALIPFTRDSMAQGGDGIGALAWFDYNNDGYEDLFLTNGIGSKNALFENTGTGDFINVTEKSGVGMAWAIQAWSL